MTKLRALVSNNGAGGTWGGCITHQDKSIGSLTRLIGRLEYPIMSNSFHMPPFCGDTRYNIQTLTTHILTLRVWFSFSLVWFSFSIVSCKRVAYLLFRRFILLSGGIKSLWTIDRRFPMAWCLYWSWKLASVSHFQLEYRHQPTPSSPRTWTSSPRTWTGLAWNSRENRLCFSHFFLGGSPVCVVKYLTI